MARWWRRAVPSGAAYLIGVGLLTGMAWGPFVLADLGHLELSTPLALIGLVGPPLAGLNLATGFNATSLALSSTWTLSIDLPNSLTHAEVPSGELSSTTST